ncbi:MAG: hypothetical protein JF621_08600 [Streptomyces turgidiscabies]|nr:hypothetical protein [Streptomyces turgidiscabies]
MNLSLPATALFTELRDTGERYPREAFEREFPGVDYDAALSEALEELKNTGPTETGQAFTYDKPKGVLFTYKSARPIRID